MIPLLGEVLKPVTSAQRTCWFSPVSDAELWFAEAVTSDCRALASGDSQWAFPKRTGLCLVGVPQGRVSQTAWRTDGWVQSPFTPFMPLAHHIPNDQQLLYQDPCIQSAPQGCGTRIAVWVWVHLCARSLPSLLKSPVTLARPPHLSAEPRPSYQPCCWGKPPTFSSPN